jgi:hypothetical protein
MSNVLLIARCVLALVFAIAAAGKLADLAAFRRTLVAFGVPAPVAGPGAVALPAVELAVAALLVPAATARAAAAAALVLLVVFSVVVGRALKRGERPDCGCLGRLRAQRVGPGTLARNAVLGVLAAMVAVGGAGRPIGDALSAVEPLTAALVAAVAVQAWFSWHLLRQHGRMITRVRALEARAAAPRAPALSVVPAEGRRAVGR